MEGPLTSSQMGCFISFSTWQALVVTELTPEHHSTEKSQGWFTTYKLTEMLSWRYCLHRDSRGLSSRQRGAGTLSVQPERTVHLGCEPAFAATWSNCLESQTRGRFAGKAEDRSQLHPLHQPCLIRHACLQGCSAHPALPSSAPALSLSWPSPLLAPGTEQGQCPGSTAPRLLGSGVTPDLLGAHVLVGQIDTQQWLLLILESLPAVNLLKAWGLLFDLFPEPIRQPEDLGKSQRACAEERCSRKLALFWYFLAGPGTHSLLRQLFPAPLSMLSSLHEDLCQDSLLRACPRQEVSTTDPTEGRKQFQPKQAAAVTSFLGP